MTARTRAPRYRIHLQPAVNGDVRGKTPIDVLDAKGQLLLSHHADLRGLPGRKRVAKDLAAALGDVSAEVLLPFIEAAWTELIAEHRRMRQPAAAGSPEAAPEMSSELLDARPDAVRRPLCLVAGRAYAAAWVQVRLVTRRIVDAATRQIVEHDPPLEVVEDRLVIVRDDGQAFADGAGVPGARTLAELGMLVHLPATLRPGRGWSGAGVKRYLAGERPQAAEVFARLVSVVDRFIDFARSLAPQETMCELVAAYVLVTYFLDAFHVVGYLWPNGDKGAAKTKFLHVLAELAYLGEVILGGSSYACLRDLADYGATLAFDDAEAVMDTRRTDPDKRTLLLAGNRRGATVAVKELEGDRWVTRYVNTFCPRSFSAIRLPDEVLGSRSIIVPLVRSGDPQRTKAQPLNPAKWPTDRGRLIDDLWALALVHLPELPGHDGQAAAAVDLAGRNLDPWQPILAVAHWLQNRHGVIGLFDRLQKLSTDYQGERSETEAEDRTRVLLRALLDISRNAEPDDPVSIRPGEVAQAMNDIARAEDLAEADKAFTTPWRVGWLLKRLRFRRGERKEQAKQWEITRKEIETAAKAYSVDLPEPSAEQPDENIQTPF